MPIIERDGDIFESGADILVNPVNCVGVMGKGLALEFKKRFPADFDEYKTACDMKLIWPGAGLLSHAHGQVIYHFPTKRHWRQPSDIEFVNLGLKHLKEMAGYPEPRFDGHSCARLRPWRACLGRRQSRDSCVA